MPDDIPDVTGDTPAPATAPAQAAVPSSGAGGAPNGVLPPSASAPPAGANAHPAGLHAVGMEGMKRLMGAMHMFRAMLDPTSEESKAADKMFAAGRRHFVPDMQSSQSGQMPPMGLGTAGTGAGQPAPMRSPQGGAQMSASSPNNLPTGPVPMRQAA